MKKLSLAAGCLLLSMLLVRGQAPRGGLGGGMTQGGPVSSKTGAVLSKIFAEHKAFTAAAVVQMNEAGAAGNNLTTPCQAAYLDGKLRLGIDLTQSKSAQIPAGMMEQLKTMGLGEIVILSDETKGMAYLIYPGLQSYTPMPSSDGQPVDASKIKIAYTEMGKETVDGHPCVKNKVKITDAKGATEEATVWNATDMKKFPVRIEMTEGKQKVVMTLQKVNFQKPDSKLMELPANYTKYDNAQTMLQEGMMKKLTGGQKPAN